MQGYWTRNIILFFLILWERKIQHLFDSKYLDLAFSRKLPTKIFDWGSFNKSRHTVVFIHCSPTTVPSSSEDHAYRIPLRTFLVFLYPNLNPWKRHLFIPIFIISGKRNPFGFSHSCSNSLKDTCPVGSCLWCYFLPEEFAHSGSQCIQVG